MSQDRVMLLIDADNVSVDVMEQGLRLLMNQHGGVHVRRAYCTAESALKHQAFFKRMGIKPMVNLAAGKNSTDIALAVDAIDLVLAERPDVVVIASSDSDFAPLVQRLREKGCVVRGIGQKGKTGDETQDVYDDYTVLEHRKPAGAAANAAAPARKAPARKTSRRGAEVARPAALVEIVAAPVPAPAPAPAPAPIAVPAAEPAVQAPVKKPAARKAAAKKTSAAVKTAAVKPAAEKPARKTAARKTKAAAAAPAEVPVLVAAPAPEPVLAAAPAPEAAPPAGQGRSRQGGHAGGQLQAVLKCLPELGEGRSLALNVAVQRLREAQLLGKNSSSLKLFSQLSDRFELHPAGKPSQVSWRP